MIKFLIALCNCENFSTTKISRFTVSNKSPRSHLKSREQGTSSLPCARSAEYFLHPVTVHSFYSTSPWQNSEHTRDSFRGKCLFLPFSQPQCINRKRFWTLFCTPTPLQLPPPILHYIRGSLEYNNSFQKLFHGSYYLRTFFPTSHLL